MIGRNASEAVIPWLSDTPANAVEITVDQLRQARSLLRYGCAELSLDAQGRGTGFVCVGDATERPRLWLAWEWSEISPSVICQTNAMAVETSVILVDAAGAPLPWSKRIIALNDAVRLSHWWECIDLDVFRRDGVGRRRFELPLKRTQG